MDTRAKTLPPHPHRPSLPAPALAQAAPDGESPFPQDPPSELLLLLEYEYAYAGDELIEKRAPHFDEHLRVLLAAVRRLLLASAPRCPAPPHPAWPPYTNEKSAPAA